MSDAVSELKSIVRKDALMRRDAIPAAERAQAAEAIAARPFPLAIEPGAIVSGFMPLKTEINPLPLLRKLAAAGARLALPAIASRGQSLRFRVWAANDRMVRGPLGILEPSPAAAEIVPDIMLVPLAAFDLSGHRIGYGAGHYDRPLAQLRKSRHITAIGLAFAAQQVEAVPALQHDAPLDYVLTEAQVFDFRSS